MSGANVGTVEVEVRPLRFTASLARMREFLALLGFSARATKADLWATLVGESGQVALHDVAVSAAGGRAGETGLWFEASDLDGLAVRFAEAGVGDVTIEDEAWGRVLTARGGGAELGFDDQPTDFYGSEVHEPEPRHGITAVAVVTGAPTGPIDRLLEAAGCTRLPSGADSERIWRGSGGGLVALSAENAAEGEQSQRLAFRTREPLTDLAARLEAAGHPVVARSDTELLVTDPDGQTVPIRTA
ncbi:hypothetical protein [Flindersiella endophytica]